MILLKAFIKIVFINLYSCSRLIIILLIMNVNHMIRLIGVQLMNNSLKRVKN